MVRSALRSWFKKSSGPLLWLAGLTMIIVYSPAGYRALNLADGENVAGFLGKSHELVTVIDSNPVTAHRLSWWEREYDVHGMVGLRRSMVSGPSPLGDQVYVRNLDRDTNRLLLLARPLPIYAVALCENGRRLCIEYGSIIQRFLSIVDVKTGKEIRTFPASDFQWNISNDGRRLAYHDLCDQGRKFMCVDVDDGRSSYTEVVGRDGDGFVSPDGKYVAISKPPGGHVIDVEGKRRVSTITSRPRAFSPDSRLLREFNGNIWDLGSSRIICRERERPSLFDCVFADRGRKIASLFGRRVTFLDLDTNEELTSEPCLPETESYVAYQGPLPPWLAAVDADGNFVRVWGPQDRQTLVEHLYGLLEKLGYEQQVTVTSPSDCWALIDARSGAVMHKGSGGLIAVSDDGRYVVSSDEEGRHVKVHELPLRRSLFFIVIAGGAWTALAMMVSCWWRRRISPEADAAEETHAHLSQATTAATPS
jgi:hypothetical protein